MKICHFCKKEITLERKVGRAESCPSCGADLHVCLNCRFYVAGSYNQCWENQAERVLDKSRSNFCEYFVFRDGASGEGQKKEDAKAKLAALFK